MDGKGESPVTQQHQDEEEMARDKKRPRLTRKERRQGHTGKRAFDLSKHHTRHIALRLSYVGWEFQGFASQKHTPNTVEERLFEALEKTCLVVDRNECSFSRGARTDKGVSALGSVVACRVRCNATHGVGVVPPANLANGGQGGEGGDMEVERADEKSGEGEGQGEAGELDYPRLLNRVLPKEIRVLAWAPVPQQFNARFDATHRTYKYFFLRKALDVDAMREAGAALLGTHDFRNFCKMDVVNVSNFERTMLSFALSVVGKVEVGGWKEELCEVELKGQAFLWHQVRCIMAVLFLVGEGKERPDIVSTLLDVAAHPRKPIYAMACELPLLLYACEYRGLEWRTTAGEEVERVRAEWAGVVENKVVGMMLVSCMKGLLDAQVPVQQSEPPQHDDDQPQGTRKGGKRKRGRDERYVALCERECEGSFEEKVAALSAKKRALVKHGNQGGNDD